MFGKGVLMKLRKAKWLLIFAIFNTLLLTGCARTKTNDNFSRIKSKQELVWGVRPDTRLFGQINIKNSQLEGFEIDLAKLLTKQVLGKKGRAVLRPISEKTR